MTPTTEQVRQAAQQAVSAQPDADIRAQTLAALSSLDINPYSQVEYERVKAHVKRLRNPKPQHGGARENSGRPATGEAHLYIGTVTATGKDGDLAHKLLSGYGNRNGDDGQWLVALTPPQARYIIQRHGDKLTLERVANPGREEIMMAPTMHLPEIADTLCSKGFSVEIAWNHHSIVVGLNRNISVDEVEAACDYEIDDDVTIVETGDGKVYLQE